LVSAFLVLVLAFPGAFLISRYEFPGKGMIMAATTVPFIIPTMVLAVGMISLFSSNGNINQIIDSVNGSTFLDLPHVDMMGKRSLIILAHIFFNFPIALRILAARFNDMDERMIIASRSLGASRLRTFFRIILPQMRYSIISSLSLVFTFCFLSFGIVLLLGGLNHTMEVEIRTLFTGLSDEKISLSGALILVETLIVLATTMVYVWSNSKEKGRTELTYFKGRKTKSKFRISTAILVIFYIILVVIIIFSPLIVIILGSVFTGDPFSSELTSRWFERIISLEKDPGMTVSPLDSIRNSILIGVLTMLISVPISFLTAKAMILKGGKGKKIIDMLLLFPLGASAVGLGYGLVTVFSSGPFKMTGTWYLIVAVHIILSYPIGARTIYNSLKAVPNELKFASRSLGASPLETFIRVELPLIMPGLLIAAVFSFAVSMGEFGATMMISSEELLTMPVFLYRTIEGGGRVLGPMYAFSVVLIAVTFFSFLSIEMIQRSFSKWGLKDGT
jgi:thiamine transport system permease protein